MYISWLIGMCTEADLDWSNWCIRSSQKFTVVNFRKIEILSKILNTIYSPLAAEYPGF